MNEVNIEIKIAKFLRAGVIIAGVVLLLGWISSLQGLSGDLSKFKIYGQVDLFTQLEIAFMDQNLGLIISYIGLILLIALPPMRVFFSTLLLIKKKEHIMATIGSVVLLGLIISFSLGIEI